MRPLHKPLLPVALLSSCLLIAGCAGAGSSINAPEFRDKTMSAQQAGGTIVIGSSTRTDVTAALGTANVVKFDSGYEVWVYRSTSGASAEEFVILFSPNGTVKKTRIRRAVAG